MAHWDWVARQGMGKLGEGQICIQGNAQATMGWGHSLLFGDGSGCFTVFGNGVATPFCAFIQSGMSASTELGQPSWTSLHWHCHPCSFIRLPIRVLIKYAMAGLRPFRTEKLRGNALQLCWTLLKVVIPQIRPPPFPLPKPEPWGPYSALRQDTQWGGVPLLG